MNILHNAEAVFAFITALAVGAGALLPSNTADSSAPLRENSVATPTRLAVVKVSAHRLTPVEKMRSLEQERALARATAAAAPRG